MEQRASGMPPWVPGPGSPPGQAGQPAGQHRPAGPPGTLPYGAGQQNGSQQNGSGQPGPGGSWQQPPWHQAGPPGYRGRQPGPPWGRPGQVHGPGRWTRGPRIPGPLRRQPQQRLLGGVAAGLAARTGLDVKAVRAVFTVAALLSGFGLAAYVAGWLLIPAADEPAPIGTRALADRRGLTLAAGLCSLLIVILMAASTLHATWLNTYAPALIIGTAGLVLLWRNASEPEQATIRRIAEPVLGLTEGRRRSAIVLRTLIAVILLLGGAAVLATDRPKHGAALWPLAGALLVVTALLVMLGPWWLRILRDLGSERQARVRAEERADIAARLHDSVLQTLALIQRRADDPQQVVQLARAQERDLRTWLFEGRSPDSLDGEGMTVATGVRLIQRDIEAQHGVTVEAVTVGDCPLDDDLSALLAAAREATLNAVKWSGAPTVSVFAEVEPGEVTLFVRDRGSGFDPAAVPADRKGLAESIRGRMARRGGTAAVRTAPGEGTEVALIMPRRSGEREPSRA
ncbi:MAG: PspC domain-containing protein [Streptosporangiaceae bacterium]